MDDLDKQSNSKLANFTATAGAKFTSELTKTVHLVETDLIDKLKKKGEEDNMQRTM